MNSNTHSKDSMPQTGGDHIRRNILDFIIILTALILMILTGYCICRYPEAIAQGIDQFDAYQPVPGAFDGLTQQEIEDLEREKAASQMIDRQVSEPSRGEVRTMTMEATAYTWTGHRTTSGTWPSRGTIAADTDVLPMGTRIYIPGYGVGVVEDRGGAIVGNKLDLYMDSRTEALQWGRKTVEVQILD